MTRDDIIRMAREAGMVLDGNVWFSSNDEDMDVDMEDLERFAALVAAAEREAISDEWWTCWQADMENGVKPLNERAVDKFLIQYPAISEFGNWLNARDQE